MKTKLFTIVTAVKDAELTIEKTILSVTSQDQNLCEYVVVDGLSKDKTLTIIEKYKDTIAKLVSESDTGIYDAFNKGIKNSTGDWIGILNSDDWYEPGILSRVANCIQQNPTAEVIYGKTRFWESPYTSWIFESSPELLESDTTMGHQSIFIKRSLHTKLGLYRTDLKYASDYEFLLKAKLKGAVFVKAPFVIANMSAGGASDRKWKSVYREVRDTQNELLGKSYKHELMFQFKILRTSLSRALSASGLNSLVALYRKHISPLKKEIERH